MGKKVWTILLFQVKWENSNETTFETRETLKDIDLLKDYLKINGIEDKRGRGRPKKKKNNTNFLW